ncbi:hypothetical protein AVEN_195600-1 [Araneus ventricosus]|uniref:Uncharacterized protein n=1 Tax=Araneus ventricosus TaxID=182803 RepID=A0A4Y2B861_ARAVE|nr:hypothetical protein AVEN_195600-1 [Araneus ventricosus]
MCPAQAMNSVLEHTQETHSSSLNPYEKMWNPSNAGLLPIRTAKNRCYSSVREVARTFRRNVGKCSGIKRSESTDRDLRKNPTSCVDCIHIEGTVCLVEFRPAIPPHRRAWRAKTRTMGTGLHSGAPAETEPIREEAEFGLALETTW